MDAGATDAGDNASQVRDASAWWGGAVADRVSCPVEVARLLSTQMNLKSGGCILSLALLSSMTLSGAVTPAETSQFSAAPLPEQSLLTFAGPWLCRVWTDVADEDAALSSAIGSGVVLTAGATISPISLSRNGSEPSYIKATDAAGATETEVSTATTFGATAENTTTHCTREWRVDSRGLLISEVPNWVPDAAGAWPATTGTPDWLAHNLLQAKLKSGGTRHKPKPRVHTTPKTTYQALSYSENVTTTPAAPVSGGGSYNPWAPVPGHPSYSVSDFSGDPNSSFFGSCTWYAWSRYQSEPLMKLGNAEAWAWNASQFGLHTGTTPLVGATAVFQPGVEGAGGAGHVAHVEAVLGGGWFIVSEMNFYWNRGGWGRVDWRYVYVTSGVTFIY